MTLRWRDLRAESVRRLTAAGIDDPERELRWIVERASGLTAAEQVAALDVVVTDRSAVLVEQMVARREGGEPLQYVLGQWGFRSLDLMVDRRVLIPRAETEVVAGLAIDAVAEARSRDEPSGGQGGPVVAVDLGTGSGVIALSLAAECWPHVEVWATDASSDALSVARANLAGLGRRASAVRIVQGDWYDALPRDLRGRVDVVVSNPPYVATGDTLPVEVAAWEPATALLAGEDGLVHLRQVILGAGSWLSERGTLVVEMGETQAGAALELADRAGLVDAEVRQDLAGRDRALVARRSGP